MKRYRTAVTLLVVVVCLLLQPVSSDDGKNKDENKERGYLGVVTSVRADMEHMPGENGMLIQTVVPRSPADEAGLLEDDIIISVDGKGFSDNAAAVQSEFSARMKEYSRGDAVDFAVLRQKYIFDVEVDGEETGVNADDVRDLRKYLDRLEAGSEVKISAKRVWEKKEFKITLGGRPVGFGETESPSQSEINPEMTGAESHLKKFASKLVGHFQISDEYDKLIAALAKTEKNTDAHRLRQFTYIHRDPFAMEAVTSDIVERISGAKDGSGAMRRFLSTAAKLLDVKEPLPPAAGLKSGLTPDQHLDQLEELLNGAVELRNRAFRDFTREEKTLYFANVEALGEKVYEHIYVHSEKDSDARTRFMRMIELAYKVDYALLVQAAAALQPLTDRAWLEKLRADFRKVGGIGKGILASKRTRHGMIFIGGTAPHWYKDREAAIIIDFGGDDFYAKNAGSSSRRTPVSVIVDMKGNDAYESWQSFSAGSGLLGVGMIYDMQGSDSYIGTKMCQAFAALGIGLIIDEKGNDIYRAQYLAQGAALWGAAAVIDLAGNDRYETGMLSQGLGLPHGFGAVIDAKGNDQYFCKGSKPSSYGTTGIFSGHGQGCGLGFRTLASGGIGLLLDGDGKDRYEAGTFSQGGGYYYSWGIQIDRGNCGDYYLGSRYAQGFSAHQAAGTFIDEGGDDCYDTRHAVHAGLAWDECVSLFIDRAGNDTYQKNGFVSFGASAHNAVCIFIDHDGKDDYRTAEPLGRVGSNDYHGGTSLSLFLDLGGGEDRYSKSRNNEIRHSGKNGIFCDLPGTLEAAMKSDTYRHLIKLPKKNQKK